MGEQLENIRALLTLRENRTATPPTVLKDSSRHFHHWTSSGGHMAKLTWILLAAVACAAGPTVEGTIIDIATGRGIMGAKTAR